MKILGSIGAIKVAKRKRLLRQTSRIKPLEACFAVHLDHNEIARAKAGSVVYSLVARKDGYEAVRVRKTKVRLVTDTAGAPLEVVSESNTDVMDGFNVPLMPHESVHELALAHFVQFLGQERVGKGDKTYACTYQRLVHRAVAA